MHGTAPSLQQRRGGGLQAQRRPCAADGAAAAFRSVPARQRLAAPRRAYASGPFPGSGYDEPQTGGRQQKDLFSRAFDFCGALAANASAVAVGRASDVLQALAPAGVPRERIETAVKGGLTLAALALLKSVLSVVLVLGAAALVLYCATQIFGFDVTLVGPSPGGDTQPRAWPPQGGAPWQQQQQQAGAYGGAYGSSSASAPGSAPWSQASAPYSQQGPYGGPAPAPGSQQGPRFQAPEPGEQGDVIDVWYGTKA